MPLFPASMSRKPKIKDLKVCDPLPETLHECLQELKRYEDYQQRLEKCRTFMLARMQDLLISPPEKQQLSEVESKSCQTLFDDNGSSEFTFAEPELAEVHRVSDPNVAYDSNKMTLRTCKFVWENLNIMSSFKADTDSSPIIAILNKLKWQYKEKRRIQTWSTKLTKLFFNCNATGLLDEGEFVRLVHQLPISNDLKDVLSTKFSRIDKDKSGAINLTEFLWFFLQSKSFQNELQEKIELNELITSAYLTKTLQHMQIYIYSVVNNPSYNTYATILFLIDTAMTLVPFITLLIEAICPRYTTILQEWDEDIFLWAATIFFAIQYILGLITCEEKLEYITNFYHVIELVSFMPWLLYEGGGYTGKEINPRGFVIFRVLRFFKLSAIFPRSRKYLEENLWLYRESFKLALVSYKAFGTFIIYMTIFFSLLIYVFERGEFDNDDKIWKRNGEDQESSFANFYNCIYFTLVTGTTLGYGDMYPRTYVGKFISLLAVMVGLVNITFLINTIGDCFEEVFRRFLQKRSAIIDEERSRFIRKTVSEAQETLDLMQKKSDFRDSLQVTKFNSIDGFILKDKSLFKIAGAEELKNKLNYETD